MYDYHDIADAYGAECSGEDPWVCVRLMENVLGRWLSKAQGAPPLLAAKAGAAGA
jgi:hypothetical protein